MTRRRKGAHLGRGEDGEPQLGLLAIVHAQALQQKGPKARSRATTDSVEHQETLQACAVVCQLPCSVQDLVNNLLADCKKEML